MEKKRIFFYWVNRLGGEGFEQLLAGSPGLYEQETGGILNKHEPIGALPFINHSK